MPALSSLNRPFNQPARNCRNRRDCPFKICVLQYALSQLSFPAHLSWVVKKVRTLLITGGLVVLTSFSHCVKPVKNRLCLVKPDPVNGSEADP